MNRLVRLFMIRDELTKQEAEELVQEMRDRVHNGENPEDILYEEGLELDYFNDIVNDSYCTV